MQTKKVKNKKHITSIGVSLLILLLMVLTLSTSTFAWYSSINRATVHDITFTAASNETVAGDLAIGWNSTDLTSAELEFNALSSQLYPMIPKFDLTNNVTTYKDFYNNGFNYTIQIKNEDNVWVTGRDGMYTTPFVLNGTDENQDYFYIINGKQSHSQTINAYYDITGLVSDKLKIAIFVGETTDDNDLILTGVMSNSEHIHYGILEENTPIGLTDTMNNAYKSTGTITFDIPANSYKVIRLVAWLDGVSMTNDDSNTSSSFNIRFDGVENES